MKNCPQCSATYPEEYVVCPKDGTRLSIGSPWEPGSVIRGKYKILAKIGKGGMATVYRAHHELLDEPRALKVIQPELARDEQFVKRFKNEAINTRKLHHPNAVRVDDLDIAEDGRPFIAMEMVEGESLKEVIQRSGPLPYFQVADIASQICDALGAAHALGLTHRDIKPDNIVLLKSSDSKPVAKILDFGIASLKEGAAGSIAGSNSLTGTGVVIGTPDYMSPEQAMGKRGDEIDGRSDIYSLGIVIYRMLTGELPFKANTTVEMILHHIQDVPQTPQTLKPQLGIPDSISAVVMKALEKDREKRFASAASMAEALRQAHRAVAANAPQQDQQRLTMVSPPPGAVAAAPQTAAPQSLEPDVESAAPQPRRSPFTAPAPRAGPAPARPFLRSPEEQKKFPIFRTVAVVGALALAALGVTRYLHHHAGQTAPTVSPPAEIVEKPSPSKPAGKPQSNGVTEKSAAEPATSSSSAPSPLLPSVLPSGVNPGSKSKTKTEDSANLHGTSAKASPSVPAKNSAAMESGNAFRPDSATSGTLGHGRSESAFATQPQSPNAGPFDAAHRFASQNETTPHEVGRQRSNLQQSQAEQAAEVLRRDMHPEIRPMNDKATEFFKNGMYMRAAQVFRNVLQIVPNNQRAQKGLEKCMEKMREIRQQKLNRQ